jgi:hypothetical protein
MVRKGCRCYVAGDWLHLNGNPAFSRRSSAARAAATIAAVLHVAVCGALGRAGCCHSVARQSAFNWCSFGIVLGRHPASFGVPAPAGGGHCYGTQGRQVQCSGDWLHLVGNPASSRRSSAARAAATIAAVIHVAVCGPLGRAGCCHSVAKLSIGAAVAEYWAAAPRPSAFQRPRVVAIARVRKGCWCYVVETGYTWTATLRPLGVPAPRRVLPPFLQNIQLPKCSGHVIGPSPRVLRRSSARGWWRLHVGGSKASKVSALVQDSPLGWIMDVIMYLFFTLWIGLKTQSLST